jgi:E3 ubiquitin-protein transferase RMND5
MHLLREGQFSVAQAFIDEANASQTQPYFNNPTQNGSASSSQMLNSTSSFGSSTSPPWEIKSEALQRQFSSMYHILHELRQNRNLQPAIDWARKYSAVLESRGSNLEFELCRLQFIAFFTSVENPVEGTLRAWAYARSEFAPFQTRYHAEIQQLTGAMAYRDHLDSSPYRRLFSNAGGAWEEVASSFTKEFCSLLGLSADSPLYVAATAGAIALPNLLKVKSVMKATRTEWTTHQEMPVEIPLPPAYHFHSIFVCPVSKEQATDANPPMMMPCGHVICKESLDRVSKGSRFKCPYCPSESHPREAKKVFL